MAPHALDAGKTGGFDLEDFKAQIGQMKNFWYDKAQVAVYMCTDVSPQTTCPDGAASAAELAAKLYMK